MYALPGIGQSVIQPLNAGNPVLLPYHDDIAGSPPPPTPSLRLESATGLKTMFNPIFRLFSAPQDRLTQV